MWKKFNKILNGEATFGKSIVALHLKFLLHTVLNNNRLCSYWYEIIDIKILYRAYLMALLNFGIYIN